jgi:hypothetical protein
MPISVVGLILALNTRSCAGQVGPGVIAGAARIIDPQTAAADIDPGIPQALGLLRR